MVRPENPPNHLAGEHSPYLLQHAHNPVDWFPWSPAALEKAERENRLIIISIGYSACHWCHVMEHESFEDEEVASIMNAGFVSIKVDREERPDIDQVYMAACQVMTGRGGWPLNIIALPDQRPVFAGTYLSNRDWKYVLRYFSDIHRLQPGELVTLARNAEEGLRQSLRIPGPGSTLIKPDIKATIGRWSEAFDPIHGGYRGAPKFPMPASLGTLLYYGCRFGDKAVLDHVRHTLERMAMGGIFDHAGGGFARYSVDAFWHVPHFEKMLYDNAQLITLYARGYAHTGSSLFRSVAERCIAFVAREMSPSDGLFCAGLDADSEGVEGGFYAWKYDSLESLLGAEAIPFSALFSCTPEGNWEAGLNVLRMSCDAATFAAAQGISEEALSEMRARWMTLLMMKRDERIRPATDFKVLTCWNSLMISALVEASLALDRAEYLQQAIRAGRFYADHLDRQQGMLWRNYQGGGFHGAGFLDDYAFLIRAFTDLYMATLAPEWLSCARSLTEQVYALFNTPGGIFFRLASHLHDKLIEDTVELTDHVIPSSNACMAWNLYVVGHLVQETGFIDRSVRMVAAMMQDIQRNPAFHALWFELLVWMDKGPVEVAVTGPDAVAMLRKMRRSYLPGVIFSGTPGRPANTTPEWDLSRGKTQIFVCRDKSCLAPVETEQEALALIRDGAV